jgi:hypothetical protein
VIFKEDWDKYVVPFIKHPGCISKDPVVAAAHLTSIQWMEALGGSHYSRTDPAFHVRKFKAKLLADDRMRILRIMREAKVFNSDVERKVLADTGL